MNFTGNVIQPQPSLIPQQQIVVPPITIPQGFTAKPSPPVFNQITARGKDAAKKIPMGPGSRAAIFEEDPEKDVFYYRELDEYGNEIAFDTYEYVKVEDPPAPEYLTKKEFYDAMGEFVKQLKEGNYGSTVRAEAEN